MSNIIQFLDGKKTYIGMAILVLGAIQKYAQDANLGNLIISIALAVAGTGARSVLQKIIDAIGGCNGNSTTVATVQAALATTTTTATKSS